MPKINWVVTRNDDTTRPIIAKTRNEGEAMDKFKKLFDNKVIREQFKKLWRYSLSLHYPFVKNLISIKKPLSGRCNTHSGTTLLTK